jgi:hypothetical protein
MQPILLSLLACASDPVGRAPAEPIADVATNPDARAEIGDPAVDFELETVDGAFRLSDHAGDVIVLDLSGFT